MQVGTTDHIARVIAGDGDPVPSPQRADAPPRIAAVTLLDGGGITLAALVEIALLAGTASGRLAFAVALVLHLAVVGAFAVTLVGRRRAGRDLTTPLLALMAIAASGPIGAVVMLVALVLLRRRAVASVLLADWYERLSLSNLIEPETRLSERIAAHRVVDTETPPPQSFEQVMRSGSLEERQRALGFVARRFHPAYLPTLVAALQSEEPVIRVQAAAVAARVRPRLADATHAWMGDAEARLRHAARGPRDGGALRLMTLARDLEAAAASGLLDKPLEVAARSAGQRLTRAVDLSALCLSRRPGMPVETLLDDFEARLLVLGELVSLRSLRRRRRLARLGFGRVRRLLAPPRRQLRRRAAIAPMVPHEVRS